jgi:hypothetical protein
MAVGNSAGLDLAGGTHVPRPEYYEEEGDALVALSWDRVEQWANGSMIRAVGDTAARQPEFRAYAYTDNVTPWSCPTP